MPSTISFLPSPAILACCLDGTGVLNLTRLHDIVIDGLMKIKSEGLDEYTFACFRQCILDFCVKSGLFTESEASRWYQQPVAEWALIECADRSSF